MQDALSDISPRTDLHLALDLGTTTLAGQLVSATGAILATSSLLNPQWEWGSDILARLERAYQGEGPALQAALVSGLRSLVQSLLVNLGDASGAVVSAVAAGNPGICCLLRNVPVKRLLFPPHKAPFREMLTLPAKEVDLGLPVPLQLFPLVSGFVGGDLVAALLAVEAMAGGRGRKGDRPLKGTVPIAAPNTLLIDLGTNAELALWDGACWRVTSAAAGPAFEGGNISSGMLLSEGAVTDVILDDDRLQLTVAGHGPPRGLCGSGLAALLAAARQAGLVEGSGRILSPDDVPTNARRYLVVKDGTAAICYHRSAVGDLLLTQEDVRNIQFAKGAVLAGVTVLLEQAGLTAGQIDRIVVTGALGTTLRPEALKRVALLPEPMLDKTSFMSNGVLAGLRLYQTSANGQQMLERLLQTLRPFPLSGTPAFEKHFLASLDF